MINTPPATILLIGVRHMKAKNKPKTEPVKFRRTIGRIAKGDNIIRCSSRKGFRNGDIEGAIYEVEKCTFMVDAADTEGFECLTSKDMAIYEYLYAHARRNGIALKFHEMSFGELMEFSKISSPTRLIEGIERIGKASVKYRPFCPQKSKQVFSKLLHTFEIKAAERGKRELKKASKKSTLIYTLPEYVKYHVQRSRSYGWVHLNTYADFKNKYSARLYSKLSILAGYDNAEWRVWEPTFSELAVYLGYARKGGDFHRGSFQRAIKAALDEINDVVMDFTFTLKKHNEHYEIYVGAKRENLFAQKAARVHKLKTLDRILDRRDSFLKVDKFPKTVWLFQAQTYFRKKRAGLHFPMGASFGISALAISKRWASDYAVARLLPNCKLGHMSANTFTNLVDMGEIKAAFQYWIDSQIHMSLEGLEDQFPDLKICDFDTADLPSREITNIRHTIAQLPEKAQLSHQFFARAETLLKANSTKETQYSASEIARLWHISINAASLNQFLCFGEVAAFQIVLKIKLLQVEEAFNIWLTNGVMVDRKSKEITEDVVQKVAQKETVIDEFYTRIIDEPPAEFDEMEELYLEQLVDKYEAQDNSENEFESVADDEDIPF